MNETLKSFGGEVLELIEEIASRKGAGYTIARRHGNDLRGKNLINIFFFFISIKT